jgi:non-heme chloroperoxidase
VINHNDGNVINQRVAQQLDPAGFWAYPPESPIHRIPGFVDASIEEGLRAFFASGQMGSARALVHELRLLRDTPLPDLSYLSAPAYLYWGDRDAVGPTSHLTRWREVLRDVINSYVYENEWHDVQYRHWQTRSLPTSTTLHARELWIFSNGIVAN